MTKQNKIKTILKNDELISKINFNDIDFEKSEILIKKVIQDIIAIYDLINENMLKNKHKEPKSFLSLIKFILQSISKKDWKTFYLYMNIIDKLELKYKDYKDYADLFVMVHKHLIFIKLLIETQIDYAEFEKLINYTCYTIKNKKDGNNILIDKNNNVINYIEYFVDNQRIIKDIIDKLFIITSNTIKDILKKL